MNKPSEEPRKTVAVRLVDVPRARKALMEAKRIIERFAEARLIEGRGDDKELRQWLDGFPEVMEGLPQRYEVGDLIEYDMDGETVPGVIVATVVCHEQYVVGPGDNREKIEGSMWMMHADSIRPRKVRN